MGCPHTARVNVALVYLSSQFGAQSGHDKDCCKAAFGDWSLYVMAKRPEWFVTELDVPWPSPTGPMALVVMRGGQDSIFEGANVMVALQTLFEEWSKTRLPWCHYERDWPVCKHVGEG